MTNMFGDMYCFEIVLLCHMYHLRKDRFMMYCYVTHSLCDVPLTGCTNFSDCEDDILADLKPPPSGTVRVCKIKSILSVELLMFFFISS